MPQAGSSYRHGAFTIISHSGIGFLTPAQADEHMAKAA
jgi:hypothetical protein